MKRILLIALAVSLSACASTKYQSYTGNGAITNDEICSVISTSMFPSSICAPLRSVQPYTVVHGGVNVGDEACTVVQTDAGYVFVPCTSQN